MHECKTALIKTKKYIIGFYHVRLWNYHDHVKWIYGITLKMCTQWKFKQKICMTFLLSNELWQQNNGNIYMYVHSNGFCFLSLKFMPLDIFFLEIKLLISSKLLNACSLRKEKQFIWLLSANWTFITFWQSKGVAFDQYSVWIVCHKPLG